jgi:hypothetical protein
VEIDIDKKFVRCHQYNDDDIGEQEEISQNNCHRATPAMSERGALTGQ